MRALPFFVAAASLATGLVTPLLADERPDHYEGKPSPTLPIAVRNFSEANTELETLLANSDLSGSDLGRVHELTYTLEVALQKIDDELDVLANTLESVHQASEKAQAGAVRKQGSAYLETARQLIP